MKQVGIIGAGAAGLCALRHVLSEDNLTPIIWEHSSHVGGTWIYTPDIGLDEHGFPIHSSMYKSLTTNLPKEIMAFPDFPFKNGEKSFIHHTDVLQYLNDYTDHFALRPLIKFNHHVDWVEPVENESGPSSWKITVKNLVEGSSSDVICDALIVCNGHYSTPMIPPVIHGDLFVGKTVHSHNYRIPEPFIDLTVVILGASASGMDISLEVAKVAKKVYLSHNFPLPIPSKLPANIHQVKGVKAAKSHGFILADGSFVEADVIIYCTGYEFTFPFLSASCGITVDENQVKPLYNHIVNSIHPSMGLIGIPFQIVPFPVFDVQVRFFIGVLDGRVSLPSRRELHAHLQPKEGTLRRHYHQLGSGQWPYMDILASEAKTQPLGSHYRKVWDITWWRRIFTLMEYKQFAYSCSGPNPDKGLQVVELLDGNVVNTSLSVVFIGIKRLCILFVFHTPSILKLLFTRGMRKVRSLFGLRDMI